MVLATTHRRLQTLGLLVGAMIVALRVTKGQSDPSDFVFFITYLAQVYLHLPRTWLQY